MSTTDNPFLRWRRPRWRDSGWEHPFHDAFTWSAHCCFQMPTWLLMTVESLLTKCGFITWVNSQIVSHFQSYPHPIQQSVLPVMVIWVNQICFAQLSLLDPFLKRWLSVSALLDGHSAQVQAAQLVFDECQSHCSALAQQTLIDCVSTLFEIEETWTLLHCLCLCHLEKWEIRRLSLSLSAPVSVSSLLLGALLPMAPCTKQFLCLWNTFWLTHCSCFSSSV